MNGFFRRVRHASDHRWTPRHLSAYLDGELAARARARLEAHTRECPECRGALHSLQRMLDRLHRLPPPSPQPEAPDITAAVRERLRDHRER